MKSLSHTQARDLIQQAADGTLQADQQRALEQHLKGCAECRAFADELAALEGALGTLFLERWGKPSLPKGSEDDLVKRLQGSFAPGGAGAGKPPRPWIWLIVLGGLILFLIFLFGTRGNPAQTAATQTMELTSTETMTPSQTNTATVTSAPEALIAVPNRNANCRLGPSATYFDIDDTLYMDTEYAPVAKGPDSEWLLFEGPASQNRCWVFIDNLDLFCGDRAVEIANLLSCTLPIEQYPPFPTLTPTPSFTPEPDEPTDTVPPSLPQCSDGIDNDSDGVIDMADGRCTSPTDNSESN